MTTSFMTYQDGGIVEALPHKNLVKRPGYSLIIQNPSCLSPSDDYLYFDVEYPEVS